MSVKALLGALVALALPFSLQSGAPTKDPEAGPAGGIAFELRLPDRSSELSLTVSLTRLEGEGERSVQEQRVTVPEPPATAHVRFEDLAAGRYRVSWVGTGAAADARVVKVGPGTSRLGLVPVRRGFTLEGDVRDELGTPVSGALVILERPLSRPNPELETRTPLHASSRADGRFAIAGLPEGETLAGGRTAALVPTAESTRYFAPGACGAKTRREEQRWPEWPRATTNTVLAPQPPGALRVRTARA